MPEDNKPKETSKEKPVKSDSVPNKNIQPPKPEVRTYTEKQKPTTI